MIMGFHFKNNKRHPINFKWSIIWVFIHFISLLGVGAIINFLNLNSFFRLIVMGFGVTILTRIAKRFISKKQFVVDIWFVFWSLIYSATVWIIFILLNALNIHNSLIVILITAIGLTVVATLVKRFKISKTILWITIIIILLILFFTQKSEQQNLVYSNIQSANVKSGNIFDSIKNILPTISSNECPQLNYPVTYGPHFYGEASVYYLEEREYGGWQIFRGNDIGGISCEKGHLQGQNPNYLYCGGYLAYIQKTYMNSDGTIGKTIKRTFVNIYDENQNFVKTICGKDPDVVAEENFKRILKEWDDFFSLN